MSFRIGDGGREVGDFTDFMNRKFSSYSNIKRDEKYGLDEAKVIAEAMRRYGLAPSFMTIKLNGVDTQVEGAIATDEFLARAGWKSPTKPVLFTVHGTGQPDPIGPGLPADTARACLDVLDWQPIGNYPAAPPPMWPSIVQGWDELKYQAGGGDNNKWANRDICLAGYSQGAMVVGQFLKHDVMDPNGSHHHLLPRIKKVVFWGNPMRQQGIANFDDWIWPIPPEDSHGIFADDLMEGLDDPALTFQVRDYAHEADMYACNKDTQADEYKRAIGKIVILASDWSKGPDSIFSQIAELLLNPIFEGISMTKAIADAIKFATSNAHGYNIGPAISFLRS